MAKKKRQSNAGKLKAFRAAESRRNQRKFEELVTECEGMMAHCNPLLGNEKVKDTKFIDPMVRYWENDRKPVPNLFPWERTLKITYDKLRVAATHIYANQSESDWSKAEKRIVNLDQTLKECHPDKKKREEAAEAFEAADPESSAELPGNLVARS